ncbi:MAG TPA: acetyl-CoA C-acyltransferase [Pirellulaceae bacterium]|nr:acetyl-CoA C-acyltransferase [Pirellulaceae bacterium]
MSASYLIAAQRTPIGKFLGGLSSVPAPQLAAHAIRAALEGAHVSPGEVDEVILGNVLQAGVGQAPARQAALAAGIPASVPAVTINKVCGSGLKAVMLADQAIRIGEAKVIVAGGMESMSLAPHLLTGARSGGWKFGPQTVLDHMQFDGLTCARELVPMGNLADYTAQKSGVSRQSQDEFALASHQRAVAAIEAGKFKSQIVPVTVRAGKGEATIERDEGPRAQATLADLAKLRPAFAADGTATAGNASQISDGAAALVVASEAVAQKFSSSIKARIVASAASGVEPKDLFIAPVSAIEKVLAKAKLTLDGIDLVELNEAFASQCLACMQPLGLAHEKVNVHGGAIALGHPIGASGARVLVTLLYALADRNLTRGLAALCLGGGNAVAMIVERAQP